MKQTTLLDRHCKPLPKGTLALSKQQVTQFRKQTRGWTIDNGELMRELKFKDYFQTMSHVIAIAMLAQSEDHHPDMEVSYNKLVIRYSTHSIGGLSENDFISAAKVNELLSKTT